MFKFLIVSLLSMAVLHANTYIFIDISQGMQKKEFNALGRLTMPTAKQEKSIYKNGQKVYMYAFNENDALSKDFIYYDKYEDENAYKTGKRKFLSLMKKIKKYGVKKRKKVGANIIFLIDTSGSMKKNGVIEDVKATMKYLIKSKSKNSKVAIVTFDGKKYMKESQKAKVLLGFEKSKTKLLQTVQKIHPSRYDTFLGAGLQKVELLLREVDPSKSLVLLFTDGKAVDDSIKALNIVKRFKNDGVKLKVIAVGGADVDMLKQFSTTGYVFNATSSDLKSMVTGISVGNDAIFLRLKSFLENTAAPTKGDNIIIYSSMMNVDAQSDFYVVPNIASSSFYKEMQKINAKRDTLVNFHGANVYVRVLGKISASKLNNLRVFYKRYFKDAHANLRYFDTAQISKSKIQ